MTRRSVDVGGRARWRQRDADTRRFTRAMVVAGLLALLAYVLVLWDFRYAPFRRMKGRSSRLPMAW